MNEDRVSIKLFVGFPLTSELRMHLRGSKSWNEAQIQPELLSIVEVQHEQKSFLGRYIETIPLVLKDLRQVEQELKQIVEDFCPKFPSDKLELITFSQVFIT